MPYGKMMFCEMMIALRQNDVACRQINIIGVSHIISVSDIIDKVSSLALATSCFFKIF